MTDKIRDALQLFADYYENKTPDKVTLEQVHDRAKKALATPTRSESSVICQKRAEKILRKCFES